VEHDVIGIATSTTTDSVSQSTPTDAPGGDGADRNREARRLVVRTQLMVRMMRSLRTARHTQTHPIVNLRQRLVNENVNDVIVAATATRRRTTAVLRFVVDTASD